MDIRCSSTMLEMLFYIQQDDAQAAAVLRCSLVLRGDGTLRL
jgi:hypothetical protein